MPGVDDGCFRVHSNLGPVPDEEELLILFSVENTNPLTSINRPLRFTLFVSSNEQPRKRQHCSCSNVIVQLRFDFILRLKLRQECSTHVQDYVWLQVDVKLLNEAC